MMKITKLFSLLLLTNLSGSFLGIAQGMKDISFLEGTWSIENLEFNDKKEWTRIGTTNSVIQWRHDGRFLAETAKYLTSYGEINMITHIGFDSRSNSYKLSAMDKEYGLMDIYKGTWSNGKLVFTNLESDLPIIMEDDRELSFRLTYSSINNNGFEHLVEGTFDGGKTWFPFSKGIYSRTTND
jgi:Protein of unknown function (DUF1579)